jgi:RNA polymerase sigma factor (sigma-70 family)
MPGRANEGDSELIAAARGGRREALDALVRRHDRWVRGVVYATLGRPEAIDDVSQQIWTTVWQQIGTLIDPERWRHWLYRLARNAALDAGERAGRERRRAVSMEADGWQYVDFPQVRAVDPAAQVIADEQRERVLRAIRALPAIYREPFVLRHLEDWSYAQIGEALDLPVDTVETRLVRARRLLREMLRTEQESS